MTIDGYFKCLLTPEHDGYVIFRDSSSENRTLYYSGMVGVGTRTLLLVVGTIVSPCRK